jgi:hypothetical protein
MFEENVIDEEERQKALSPEVGIGIKVNGSAGDMSKALQPLTYAPNQQLAVEEDLLRANAREQLGMSRNQLGEYTGGRKTAREVGTVDRASQLRMSRRGLAVKRLYQDSIRTTNNIIFSYWTLPRYVDILGEANARKWVQINGPALRGRYNYDIEFVDEAELNERKLMALQLYGQLAKDPGVDPVALREWLSGQVNDPAFERIFSADIRQRMLELSALNGAIQSQSASGGQSNGGVRALQGADGQVSDPATNASRFLAGRGTGAGPYSG